MLEVIPEFDPDLLAAFRTVLTTGEPYASLEQRVLLDRDGDGVVEEYWFNFACQPQRDAEGTVTGVISVAVEVTEQVLVRHELERANSELEEFTYVTSHDLQEPLRTINIYTELMSRQLGPDADQQSQHFAKSIHRAVQHMAALIKDLLSYSHVVSGELNSSTVDLAASFGEAIQALEVKVKENGASISCDPLPLVLGDERQFTQVFINLISNSLKYRLAGVVPVIHVAAARRGSEWVISVHDNGIGFEPQYAERIFGLFKRLHRDEYPGTGLGLAICKRIVERSGGTTWAVSEGEGLGATLFFSARVAANR